MQEEISQINQETSSINLINTDGKKLQQPELLFQKLIQHMKKKFDKTQLNLTQVQSSSKDIGQIAIKKCTQIFDRDSSPFSKHHTASCMEYSPVNGDKTTKYNELYSVFKDQLVQKSKRLQQIRYKKQPAIPLNPLASSQSSIVQLQSDQDKNTRFKENIATQIYKVKYRDSTPYQIKQNYFLNNNENSDGNNPMAIRKNHNNMIKMEAILKPRDKNNKSALFSNSSMLAFQHEDKLNDQSWIQIKPKEFIFEKRRPTTNMKND